MCVQYYNLTNIANQLEPRLFVSHEQHSRQPGTVVPSRLKMNQPSFAILVLVYYCRESINRAKIARPGYNSV
jgi:hypothetical protein